ncbi:MAG TPA: ABC transporter ATP-binding protein [Paludibacter sp.]|nr:ABC transporter ATP-binding protein [Paludibacter sp.]
MKKIVEIQGLDFHYRNQPSLLSNLNLQFHTGSIYGLVGKNGEGKSTLLKIISGLVFPLRGKVKVLGVDSHSRKSKILERIFFLPEEIELPSLNTQQFESVYAPFYRNFNSAMYHELLNNFMVELPDKLDKLPYSQRKKFSIAFGLATNAQVILLDEPTKGLDHHSKKQFLKIISSASSNKNCILVSMQQLDGMEDIIDTFIYMDNHQVVFKETGNLITQK